MNITSASLVEKLHNLSSLKWAYEGESYLMVDSGAATLGIRLSEENPEQIAEPIKIIEPQSHHKWSASTHSVTDLNALVTLIFSKLDLEEAPQRRITMPANEVVQMLEKSGFKACVEHTGGGTFTIYFNLDGEAPFLVGPASHCLGDTMMFSTDELNWGLDGEFVHPEDSGDPAGSYASPGDDIRVSIEQMMQEYRTMLDIGRVESWGGNTVRVMSKDCEEFNELILKALA